MLTPLHQFVCDTCGRIIDSPQAGYLEWESAGAARRGFKIVHNRDVCLRNRMLVCTGDSSLDNYLGPNGFPYLLSYLHVGFYHDPHGNVSGVENVPEFTEIIRRLTIPYYEEARFYFNQARSDGLLDGANELSPYLDSLLPEIVKRYSQFP